MFNVIYFTNNRNLLAFKTIKIQHIPGKNLEYGLRKLGLLTFVRELDGNDEEDYDNYLRDASMYARGNFKSILSDFFLITKRYCFSFNFECQRSVGQEIHASSTRFGHDER